jgi:hypothetical protein
MKKTLTILVLLVTSFVLSSCDILDSESNNNIWYDEGSQTLHISYKLSQPKEDDETGLVPVEALFLQVKSDGIEWQDITELDQYREDDLQVNYSPTTYGEFMVRIVKRNENNEQIYESAIFNVYINEPQFVYNFDVNFDSWNGVVFFNMGLNENLVKTFTISKSIDGGNEWAEVISEAYEFNEQDPIKNSFQYYEYDEGNYVYKLSVFDADNTLLEETNSWSEIHVYYENNDFEGSPVIDYVGTNIDIYSRNVNIWWNSRGDFDNVRIEKSEDLETWTLLDELPRFVQSFNYIEDVDGQYYYRITALKDEESLSNFLSENPLRVTNDAYIGFLEAWVEYDTQSIYVNWDFQSDSVSDITIERRSGDEDYILIETFGELKRSFTSENLEPGFYQYKVTLLDADNMILDSLETKVIEIETPKHVYHLNAWFNQAQGEIQFNFGFNQNQVVSYKIEKSSDGGLTWEEFLSNQVELQDTWYKDSIIAYELVEGVYAYRITGFNESDSNVGMAYSYNEVVVDYSNLNFDEPTEVYHIEGNYNIYDQSVNLWWGSQGTYENHLLEVSTDETTWTELLILPRMVTFVKVESLIEGTYYFRLSAIDEDNNVISSKVTENSVYVRENALIGSIYTWFDSQGNNLNINWDTLKDNVFSINVYRTTDSTSTTILVGEFGNLKTTILDTLTESDTYFYTVVLFDEDGEVLDQLSSTPIEVYIYE